MMTPTPLFTVFREMHRDTQGRRLTMNKEQFVHYQDASSLSNIDLAEVLGVGPRQIVRYRLGDAPIPGPVARIMRVLHCGLIDLQ